MSVTRGNGGRIVELEIPLEKIVPLEVGSVVDPNDRHKDKQKHKSLPQK